MAKNKCQRLQKMYQRTVTPANDTKDGALNRLLVYLWLQNSTKL